MEHEILNPLEAGPPGDRRCTWCGDPALVEIFEAWGHEVMFETCCAARLEAVSDILAGDAREAAEHLRALGVEDLLGGRLRGFSTQGPGFELDFQLSVRPVRFAVARSFVLTHHHHCRPPAGWRFGLGCWNGPTLVGVAMVGRPVARMLDASRIVEVNRLCIDRTLSDALRRNAASKLLGAAAREARRRGFARIITYTLERESGASLRAAGWTAEHRSPGGIWSRPSRGRGSSGPTDPKIRWARAL